MPSVDASSLFDKIKEIFEKCNLSFSKLLAMLMDSCSVMRGEKGGLETRVREVAPHLIDVDGDSCHDIHNFVKKMTSHFRYSLESLFREIYHDFQHSLRPRWKYWKAWRFTLHCLFVVPLCSYS